QFDREEIGTKKGPRPKIDSLKALKNIQNMIQETMKITEDSVFTPAETYDAGTWKMPDTTARAGGDSNSRNTVKPVEHPVKAAPQKVFSVKPALVKRRSVTFAPPNHTAVPPKKQV